MSSNARVPMYEYIWVQIFEYRYMITGNSYEFIWVTLVCKWVKAYMSSDAWVHLSSKIWEQVYDCKWLIWLTHVWVKVYEFKCISTSVWVHLNTKIWAQVYIKGNSKRMYVWVHKLHLSLHIFFDGIYKHLSWFQFHDKAIMTSICWASELHRW